MFNDASAESSTATPEAVPMESWTDEQRSSWLNTGNTPEAPKTEDSATSQETSAAGEKTPAEPVPASEPGNDKEPKKRSAEGRKQELSTEIQDLLRQRRELQEELTKLKPEQKPESSTGKQPEAKTETGRPVRPKFEDFETYDLYEAAVDKYTERLADWRFAEHERAGRERAEQQKATEKQREVERTWETRQEAARKVFPDYDAVADAAEGKLPVSPAMAKFMLNSEVGALVGYTLARDLENAQRIAELDPVDAIRELVKIEASLSSKATPDQPKVPKPKTITTAAKPVTELSGKSAAPEDEAAAALEAGDFARYQRVMNAREKK